MTKGRKSRVNWRTRAHDDKIQFRSNENQQNENHWDVPAGPLGAVGSLCTRAGAIAGYANGGRLPKEVITLPTFAQPPTSHRNFNSCRSYMLIQNQNRFPTASSAALPKFMRVRAKTIVDRVESYFTSFFRVKEICCSMSRNRRENMTISLI